MTPTAHLSLPSPQKALETSSYLDYCVQRIQVESPEKKKRKTRNISSLISIFQIKVEYMINYSLFRTKSPFKTLPATVTRHIDMSVLVKKSWEYS